MGTRSKQPAKNLTPEQEALLDKLVEEDIGNELKRIMHSPEFAEHFFKVHKSIKLPDEQKRTENTG